MTPAVWAHPLFPAVRILENRRGIQEGTIAAAAALDTERDPFADTWLPAPEAARRKGVALSGLHEASTRGAVVARTTKPAGGPS